MMIPIKCVLTLAISSDDEMTDVEMGPLSWNEIESDSHTEFLEDHGLVQEVSFFTSG